MTKQEQLQQLLQQMALESLTDIPANIPDGFKAIAVLQSTVLHLQGQLNLILSFITSTEDSKKAFRDFVKLAANADIPKENHRMQQAARILDLMYPETDGPQSHDKPKGPPQSQSSIGSNVILFPGFPRKDPKQ